MSVAVIKNTTNITSGITPRLLSQYDFSEVHEDSTGIELHNAQGIIARYSYAKKIFAITQYGKLFHVGHILSETHLQRILKVSV